MKTSIFSFAAVIIIGIATTVQAQALFKDSPFASIVNGSIRTQATNLPSNQNNYVQILNNGDDALLLRTYLIRQAVENISTQTFIWTNDEVGRFLMYELIKAARRGVAVNIIADHFVSHKDPEIIAFLATAHPNLKIKHYRPAAGRIKPSTMDIFLKTIFKFRALNQRMHNKVMIVDDIVAITGGRNIENTYYNLSTEMNFKDRDALVIGPVVKDIKRSFLAFWNYKHAIASSSLKDVAAVINKGSFQTYETCSDFLTGGLCEQALKDLDSNMIKHKFVDSLIKADRVEFVADMPGKNRARWLRGKGAITKRLMKLTKKADQRIIIQSPYFVLNKSARKFFSQLKTKTPNLQVTISSNSFGSTDNIAAYSANYRLRSCYIESLGFHVFEYKPHPGNLLKIFPTFQEMVIHADQKIKAGKQKRGPFLCLHSKSLVIDDRIAFIGSYNLDPRSQNLNTEVGLIIEDEMIAKELSADILNDCRPENSWVIAKRKMPLSTDKLNAMVEEVMRLSPIDIWPIRNTSSFDLLSGKTPVPPDNPDFYSNYKDIGSFPGAPPGLSIKEITTRIYKAIGGAATPLL